MPNSTRQDRHQQQATVDQWIMREMLPSSRVQVTSCHTDSCVRTIWERKEEQLDFPPASQHKRRGQSKGMGEVLSNYRQGRSDSMDTNLQRNITNWENSHTDGNYRSGMVSVYNLTEHPLLRMAPSLEVHT